MILQKDMYHTFRGYKFNCLAINSTHAVTAEARVNLVDEFVCAQYTFVDCVIGFEFWNATLTKGVELGIFC